MDDLEALIGALGCGITGLGCSRFASATFTGWRLEVETDADLPDDIDTREFPSIDRMIVADAAAVAPRKLEMLLVDCG